uniref:Holin n=1 Tax=Salmonella phage vB_SEnST11_KE23 TaxID=3161174 RepID=A0AAU8GFW4_9CAUD
MTNMIYTTSKTNLFGAVLLACFIALVSNTCFNGLACLVTTETTAQGFNTMIDVLQLTVYTMIKLIRFKRLDRYDLPFVIAGVLAIAL